MSRIMLSAFFGLFVCAECPGEECSGGGVCEMPWADELPPLGDDYWPSCKCCGKAAELVAPLVRV